MFPPSSSSVNGHPGAPAAAGARSASLFQKDSVVKQRHVGGKELIPFGVNLTPEGRNPQVSETTLERRSLHRTLRHGLGGHSVVGKPERGDDERGIHSHGTHPSGTDPTIGQITVRGAREGHARRPWAG